VRDFSADPIGFVDRRFDTFGSTYFTVSRGAPLFVTREVDVARDVLVHRAADFEKRSEDLADLLGSGLVNSNGELWRRQRRRIQPAFHRARLETYVDVFSRRARQWAEARRTSQQLDLRREMTQLTLQVVAETLFGQNMESNARWIARIMDAVQEGANVILPGWVPTPGRLQQWTGLAVLDRVLAPLIAAKRKAPGTDLLSSLVQVTDEEGAMSGQQLRDEVVTLFAAGHDTTALALTWTLWSLARHAEQEAAVRDELVKLGDRPVTLADLDQLAVLDRCLDEALRLYPPAYAVTRRAVRPTRIGSWDVQAGDEVVIWIFHLHRDPRHFDAPHEYRPQRWEAGTKSPAFMPFGAGQRACVGMHFARFEAKAMLAEILRQVRLHPMRDEPVGFRPRITLSPGRPIQMRVERMRRRPD
jgi:cytochrome P450